jgi:hypothetical protein
MTDLPLKSQLTGNVTQGQYKTAMDQLVDALTERLVSGITPILANVINEATANAGVTIDGLLVKDGEIQLDLGGGKTVKLLNMTAADYGKALQVNAAGTALAAIGPGQGFRNRVINGDFRVAQRATSFINANGYTLDRFFMNRGGGAGGLTVSRVTDAPPGFGYAMKAQRVPGDTDAVSGGALYYTLESADCRHLAGKVVTLSFWAKKGANYSGGNLSVNVTSGTGVDEKVYLFTGASNFVSTSQALTTSWARYTFTGTMPSNATELGFKMSWVPTGTAGTDDSVYLTGFQLEEGPNATPFEVRPLAAEVALCQRYFAVVGAGTMGTAYTTSAIAFGVRWPVPMRAGPTVSLRTTAPSIYQQSNGSQSGSGSSLSASGGAAGVLGGHYSLNGFTGLIALDGRAVTLMADLLNVDAEI